MAQLYEFETRSGSVYWVRVDADDRWWLSGDNVPNIFSWKMDGEWEIVKPTQWPPIIGQRYTFDVPPELELGDPRRMPGGSKYVSAIVRAEVLE